MLHFIYAVFSRSDFYISERVDPPGLLLYRFLEHGPELFSLLQTAS